MRESLENLNVLITGGAGFIGSHLADRLIEIAGSVAIVDNLFLGTRENIASAVEKGAHFYSDDAELLSSLEYIVEDHDIDVVFNCATKALNYSFINPSNAFDTNTKVALNLLELQRKKKFATLCHFSTSEVYGTAVYEPMDENHPRNPTTTYAAGKAAADLAVESYVRMFDLDAFIVRPFNNYGPRQNFEGPLAGVIPVTAWRIHNGLSPVIHGTGEQSRDFIYVTDTVDATLNLYSVASAGESYNLSTDNQVTIKDLVEKICAYLSFEGEIETREARYSDVFCHNATSEKVRNLIDYKITPFDEGLAKSLDWYSQQFSKLK